MIIHKNSILISRGSKKSNQLLLTGHGAFKLKKDIFWFEKTWKEKLDIPNNAKMYFYTRHGQPQVTQDQAKKILESKAGYIGGFQGGKTLLGEPLTKEKLIKYRKMYVGRRHPIGKKRGELLTKEEIEESIQKKYGPNTKIVQGYKDVVTKGQKTYNYYLWPITGKDKETFDKIIKDHQAGKYSRLVDICIIRPSTVWYHIHDLGRSLEQIFDLIKKEIKPLYTTYHWSACRVIYGKEMVKERKYEKSEES